LTISALAGCASGAVNEVGGVGWGPNPALPPPRKGLLPIVRIAPPVGWAPGETPAAPPQFVVTLYSDEVDHPRQIHVLPNGDVLVAQAATRPSRCEGIVGWIKNQIERDAGAIEPAPNRITLLRDSDGDGDVDFSSVLLDDLNQPFGMALVGEHLYVGNTDAVVRFPYRTGQARIEGRGETVVQIPYYPWCNGHWTRDLLASGDGSRLHLSVGSRTNIPKGKEFALEQGRAAVWEIDLASGAHRIFASGLRNPNGLAREPRTGALWVVVNERDGLGDNLVPDYMTRVRDGGFYGWPYSYFGQHVDRRVRPQRPDLVARAIVPDYGLGSHTAPLGMTFYNADAFPARYRGGVFVAQHGSTNRSAPAGYQVVFVPFVDGRPSGRAEPFVTGFLNERNRARGRPVSVAVDRTGALLVSDDVGDAVWRVAAR
jgi:glucose/arabinose dehydrogenase